MDIFKYGANIDKTFTIENPYWKDVIMAWTNYCKNFNVERDNIGDILAEPLWLNHNYKNPQHLIMHWADMGVLTIRDLCDEQGIMPFDEIKLKYNIRGTLLDYNYLLHILPDIWKNVIESTRTIPAYNICISVYQRNLLKLSKGSRRFYDKLISNPNRLEICEKWEMIFNEFEFDWHNIFNSYRHGLKDVKRLDFQYRFLQRVI